MKISESAIAGLHSEGYAIIPNALLPEVCSAVRKEVRHLQDLGLFRAAGIGKGESHQTHLGIRRDGTLWFDPKQLTSVQKPIWRALEEIRQTVNEELMLGLWEFEGHYAIYAPGAFYRKHFDRFQSDSRRTLSIVLFFNEDWKPEHGGLLRIARPEGDLDILPESGKAVLFLSERVLHEVTETHRERLSFAGWFKQRE